MCACACAHVHAVELCPCSCVCILGLYIRGPEGNLQCHSSEDVHLGFWDRVSLWDLGLTNLEMLACLLTSWILLPLSPRHREATAQAAIIIIAIITTTIWVLGIKLSFSCLSGRSFLKCWLLFWGVYMVLSMRIPRSKLCLQRLMRTAMMWTGWNVVGPGLIILSRPALAPWISHSLSTSVLELASCD